MLSSVVHMSAAASEARRSLCAMTLAAHRPRIGGTMPRPRSNPARATEANPTIWRLTVKAGEGQP